MHDLNIPVVSVCMITYNHEPYISQAIEGVLMQRCSFPFELVIGEDASLDKTLTICKEYAIKYPEIRLISYQSNIGMLPNFFRTLQACEGKYIALCEGDDYWTDPYKLQNQFEFLEANPGFSACFTNSEQINENNQSEKIFVQGLGEGYVPERTIIIKGGGLYPTASLVFKRDSFEPQTFKDITELAGDELLIMALATKGKIYFFNHITCIYRNWNGGVFSSIKDNIPKICELKKKGINGYRKFDLITKRKFHKLLNQKISHVSQYIILNSNELVRFRYIFNLRPKEIICLFHRIMKLKFNQLLIVVMI